jgi:hypothetical protein
MNKSQSSSPRASAAVFRSKAAIAASILAGAITMVLYTLTAFRTITWWNSPEYSLAAITLGVQAPPGSLLCTLLGWLAVQLPLGLADAFTLNLLAGAYGAAAVAFVAYTGVTLFRISDSFGFSVTRKQSYYVIIIGAVLGALTFGFSETLWENAIKYNPYVLTALFSALILWAMVRWWEKADRSEAVGWLFVIALLFGLDVSVHRTNLLLFPGLFVWVALRRGRAFKSWRAWGAGLLGLVLGLGVHLLIIPMAMRHPFLDMSNPDSLAGFYDYVSLRQAGGGFLFNLWPRNADIFGVQVMDYLRAFSANFASFGSGRAYLGVLPGIVAVVGFVRLWRLRRKLCVGLLVLFLLSSVGAIIYFNIPANFFRSLHRHYLPSFVVFSVFITYGAGSVMLYIWKVRSNIQTVGAGIALLLLVLTPVQQALANFDRMDNSENYFAYDISVNIINSLPENAILLTGGDNDTFPLWYLKICENIRPDVTILNIFLLNTTWYVEHLKRVEPDLPLDMTEEQVAGLSPLAWSGDTVALPVRGTNADFDLPDSISLADTLHVYVSPTLEDRYLYVSDQVVLNILKANRWRRPICVGSYVSGSVLGWLRPYLRFEGYALRLVPVESPPDNIEIVRRNIIERSRFRGYHDTDIPMSSVTRQMALGAYIAFLRLSGLEQQSGDLVACRKTLTRAERQLNPSRLDLPPNLVQAAESLCSEPADD